MAYAHVPYDLVIELVAQAGETACGVGAELPELRAEILPGQAVGSLRLERGTGQLGQVRGRHLSSGVRVVDGTTLACRPWPT